MNKKIVAQELANAILATPWGVNTLAKRLSVCFGFESDWMLPLAEAIYLQFTRTHPKIKQKELAWFIFNHHVFREAWTNYLYQFGRSLSIRDFSLELPTIIPPILMCDIPDFKTVKDLSIFLNLSVQKLEGYADNHGLERKSAAMWQRHYHYIWKNKAKGSTRLLEIPKSNLRHIQRQIDAHILQRIPLHSACHGFRKNHSCLSYASPHCSEKVVIKMDLMGFFPSIRLCRVHSIFETIGYRTEIARLLSGLCSNQVPSNVLKSNPSLNSQEIKQYSTPHLAQWAPVSPSLSNLSAYKLDVRLDSLLKSMDGRYTRYADDLAFSGDFKPSQISRLHTLVAQIITDEGFILHRHKTKIMYQNGRQSLTGLVVNQHLNYPRYKYDRLKAMLFNCVRYGPDSQNKNRHSDFRSHLQGKIAYIKAINPTRAKKLEGYFKQIDWIQ